MSQVKKFPAEYGNVPESPMTREFVYWNLLEYFDIHHDSELRPGGMRRGTRHTASLDDLHDFLYDRSARRSRVDGPRVAIARATLPKVLLELSILKNAGGAYTYAGITFYESKLYVPKDPSMTDEELKSAGYKEEYAEEIFRYSPLR